MSLKPYYQCHQTSRLFMLYQYVFSPRVNLNLFILISYLIPCDVIHKGGYFNSPYNQGIPSLHQDILVIKTSQLLQLQIM